MTAIEIKSASTYNKNLIKNLAKFDSIAKDQLKQAYLVYAGQLEQQDQTTAIINYNNIATKLTDIH